MDKLLNSVKDNLFYEQIPIKKPFETIICHILERFNDVSSCENTTNCRNIMKKCIDESISVLSKTQQKIILKLLLNTKGIKCRPKKTTSDYLSEILDMFEAEHRYYISTSMKGFKILEYNRFNPDRGYTSKKNVASLEKDKQLKLNVDDCGKVTAMDKHDKNLKFCRQCHFVCPPRKRSFCSQGCVHLYLIRSNGYYARKCLMIRDKGVCDICGLSTEKLRKHINSILNKSISSVEEKKEWLVMVQNHFCDIFPSKLYMNKKYILGRGSFWHADHIIAVSEGGGQCDLSGYRTLCIQCHKKMTLLLSNHQKVERKYLSSSKISKEVSMNDRTNIESNILLRETPLDEISNNFDKNSLLNRVLKKRELINKKNEVDSIESIHQKIKEDIYNYLGL